MARKECLNYNQPWKKTIDVARADLVSIMSSKEQNFLEQEYRKLRIFSGFFWTGLNRNHSDSFTWADHSKLSYQNWKKQPHGDAKSCVRSSISMSAQGWEAVTCSEQNYFVCKLKRGI